MHINDKQERAVSDDSEEEPDFQFSYDSPAEDDKQSLKMKAKEKLNALLKDDTASETLSTLQDNLIDLLTDKTAVNSFIKISDTFKDVLLDRTAAKSIRQIRKKIAKLFISPNSPKYTAMAVDVAANYLTNPKTPERVTRNWKLLQSYIDDVPKDDKTFNQFKTAIIGAMDDPNTTAHIHNVVQNFQGLMKLDPNITITSLAMKAWDQMG